jgi:hypothetical protein
MLWKTPALSHILRFKASPTLNTLTAVNTISASMLDIKGSWRHDIQWRDLVGDALRMILRKVDAEFIMATV